MLGNEALWEVAEGCHELLVEAAVPFADVVKLIAAHDLSRSFARHLHKSLRPAFRELVLRARGQA